MRGSRKARSPREGVSVDPVVQGRNRTGVDEWSAVPHALELPAVYRDANLLRDALLKSYSGGISSAEACRSTFSLLRVFFIVFALASRRSSALMIRIASPRSTKHRAEQSLVLRDP